MNSSNLVGRLTHDPELKTTPNGVSVCSFTIAVNRPRVKDTTDFINCVVWRASAEYLAKYGHKGSLVAVSGTLTSRKYTDKEGNNRTTFEVIADNVSLCESRQSGQASASSSPTIGDFEEITIDDSAELPF